MDGRSLDQVGSVSWQKTGPGHDLRQRPTRPGSNPGFGFVPEQLGSYSVSRRVASGGMAEVFLGRGSDSATPIALKRIRPTLADDPGIVAMFLDEARLAAAFDHPNLVKVFDVGEQDGGPFIAMEFLHGENVRNLMSRAESLGGRVPLGCALRIVLGALAGLHHAHDASDERGRPLRVVHRDVSPHNVMVTFDGRVKMVDFGIAKSTENRCETQAGVLKGKLNYMAPEQCGSKATDRRTDVYSASILLWEITTGARFYGELGELEILHAVLERAPTPPSLVCSGYPPELERIVMKGLARDPRDRYQTADDMRADLEAFSREHGIGDGPRELARYMRQVLVEGRLAQRQAPPVTSPRRIGRLATAALALVLGIGLGVASFSGKGTPVAVAAAASAAAPSHVAPTPAAEVTVHTATASSSDAHRVNRPSNPGVERRTKKKQYHRAARRRH